jgi:hypothetical protein
MISLQRDRVDGDAVCTEIIDSPSEEIVVAALRALDGRVRTQLWLHQHDGRHLMVSGPVNGRYAVDYSTPNGDYSYATDPSQPEGNVMVPAGYDEARIPLKGLVDAQATEVLLREFLSSGTLGTVVKWEVPE